MTTIKVCAAAYRRRVVLKWDEYKRWIIETDFPEPEVEHWCHVPPLLVAKFPDEATATMWTLRWF